MIKVDIVNEVSRVAEITKVKAELAVDAVFEAMRHSMQRGERIELRGLWRFSGKAPQARHRPQSPHRQGSSHPARPHDPVQARQRAPEHRVSRVSDWRSNAFLRHRCRASASRFLFPPPYPPRDRVWLHVLLFVLTVVTTTLVGALHYFGFRWASAAAPSSRRRCAISRSMLKRAVVQRDDSGHPRLSRDGPLPCLPLLPRRCVAAVLPAGAATADRHARRVHPDSSSGFRRRSRSSTSASRGRLPGS